MCQVKHGLCARVPKTFDSRRLAAFNMSAILLKQGTLRLLKRCVHEVRGWGGEVRPPRRAVPLPFTKGPRYA